MTDDGASRPNPETRPENRTLAQQALSRRAQLGESIENRENQEKRRRLRTIGKVVAGIVATGVIPLVAIMIDREFRTDEAVERAWDRINEYPENRKKVGGLAEAVERVAADCLNQERNCFRDIDLIGAPLEDLRLPEGAIMRGVQLAGAMLQNAVMVDVDMNGAILNGARFVGHVSRTPTSVPPCSTGSWTA